MGREIDEHFIYKCFNHFYSESDTRHDIIKNIKEGFKMDIRINDSLVKIANNINTKGGVTLEIDNISIKRNDEKLECKLDDIDQHWKMISRICDIYNICIDGMNIKEISGKSAVIKNRMEVIVE